MKVSIANANVIAINSNSENITNANTKFKCYQCLQDELEDVRVERSTAQHTRELQAARTSQ